MADVDVASKHGRRSVCMPGHAAGSAWSMLCVDTSELDLGHVCFFTMQCLLQSFGSYPCPYESHNQQQQQAVMH
jgi:hypothetical protein